MDITDKVLKAMASSNEPLRPGDIAEKAGIDKKDVDKALKILTSESKVFSPKRCFYAIKK